MYLSIIEEIEKSRAIARDIATSTRFIPLKEAIYAIDVLARVWLEENVDGLPEGVYFEDLRKDFINIITAASRSKIRVYCLKILEEKIIKLECQLEAIKPPKDVRSLEGMQQQRRRRKMFKGILG